MPGRNAFFVALVSQAPVVIDYFKLEWTVSKWKCFDDKPVSPVVIAPKRAGQGGRCPLAGRGAEPRYGKTGFHKNSISQNVVANLRLAVPAVSGGTRRLLRTSGHSREAGPGS